jgi:hypothetical protein
LFVCWFSSADGRPTGGWKFLEVVKLMFFLGLVRRLSLGLFRRCGSG